MMDDQEQQNFRYAIFADLAQAQAFSRAIFDCRKMEIERYEPDTLYWSAVEHAPPGNVKANGDRWFVPLPSLCSVEIPEEAELVEQLPEGWWPEVEDYYEGKGHPVSK